MSDPGPPDLDLGSGFLGWWFEWSPDRELNPQYDGIPDIEKAGLSIEHPDTRDPSKRCTSAVTFNIGGAAKVFHHPLWEVESWEPLTISPSILCKRCGSHGFIREGKWVE